MTSSGVAVAGQAQAGLVQAHVSRPADAAEAQHSFQTVQLDGSAQAGAPRPENSELDLRRELDLAAGQDAADVVALLGRAEVPLREGARPGAGDAGQQVLGRAHEHFAHDRPDLCLKRVRQLRIQRRQRRGSGLSPCRPVGSFVGAPGAALLATPHPGRGQPPADRWRQRQPDDLAFDLHGTVSGQLAGTLPGSLLVAVAADDGAPGAALAAQQERQVALGGLDRRVGLIAEEVDAFELAPPLGIVHLDGAPASVFAQLAADACAEALGHAAQLDLVEAVAVAGGDARAGLLRRRACLRRHRPPLPTPPMSTTTQAAVLRVVVGLDNRPAS